MPVSYTHLDVYKRQALGCGLLQQLVPDTVYDGDGDFTVGGRCEHTEVVDLAGGGIIQALSLIHI